MAHSHAHAETEGTYFLDQLFTILVCAGIGLVAVLMYKTGMLDRILVPMFYLPVMLGGVLILLMTAIRAVAVWKLAGARQAAAAEDHSAAHAHAHDHEECGHDHSHGHEHSHGEECAHDHAHSHSHSHSHAHSHAQAPSEEHHDHGWAPWKYMILAVPIFLYFLGFPRAGLGNLGDKFGRSIEKDQKRQTLSMLTGGSALTKVLRKTEPRHLNLRFQELTEIAARPSLHNEFEGDYGKIRGQFMPLSSSGEDFTLFRVDRTCCYADQTYLQMVIEVTDDLQRLVKDIRPEQWVMVKGTISFRKNAKGNFIPVILVKDAADIQIDVEPALNVKDF